jgi:hypothetical protein
MADPRVAVLEALLARVQRNRARPGASANREPVAAQVAHRGRLSEPPAVEVDVAEIDTTTEDLIAAEQQAALAPPEAERARAADVEPGWTTPPARARDEDELPLPPPPLKEARYLTPAPLSGDERTEPVPASDPLAQVTLVGLVSEPRRPVTPAPEPPPPATPAPMEDEAPTPTGERVRASAPDEAAVELVAAAESEEAERVEAQILARVRAPREVVAAFVGAGRAASPASFGDALDATLSL